MSYAWSTTSGATVEYIVKIAVEDDGPWVGIDKQGNFYRGNPNATVTLEEFMDFQCPYCARHAMQTGPLIQEAYIDTGQVRQVFHNFPLESIHAERAARGQSRLLRRTAIARVILGDVRLAVCKPARLERGP